MVLKKIMVHVQLSQEAWKGLMATYPTIIQRVETEANKTIFYVDITPAQETEIRPVLMDAIIQIEPLS